MAWRRQERHNKTCWGVSSKYGAWYRCNCKGIFICFRGFYFSITQATTCWLEVPNVSTGLYWILQPEPVNTQHKREAFVVLTNVKTHFITCSMFQPISPAHLWTKTVSCASLHWPCLYSAAFRCELCIFTFASHRLFCIYAYNDCWHVFFFLNQECFYNFGNALSLVKKTELKVWPCCWIWFSWCVGFPCGSEAAYYSFFLLFCLWFF